MLPENVNNDLNGDKVRGRGGVWGKVDPFLFLYYQIFKWIKEKIKKKIKKR